MFGLGWCVVVVVWSGVEWLILISLMRMDWGGYSLVLSPFAGRILADSCAIAQTRRVLLSRLLLLVVHRLQLWKVGVWGEGSRWRHCLDAVLTPASRKSRARLDRERAQARSQEIQLNHFTSCFQI